MRQTLQKKLIQNQRLEDQIIKGDVTYTQGSPDYKDFQSCEKSNTYIKELKTENEGHSKILSGTASP